MRLNYSDIREHILNQTVPTPLSGTLSGHAAGEPFEKNVFKKIKELYPSNTFKQFEYLNKLFLDNPQCTTYEERLSLFESDLVSFLIRRGKDEMGEWNADNLFEEKQNDTADILYVDNGFYEIIDVKTRNMSKDAQAPNIISAYKLAQAMKIMLDTGEFDKIDIVYVEVDWIQQGENLVATDAHIASIFKTNPNNLYINWAASRQIQFHVSELQQDFKGTQEEWAREYLAHYYESALKQVETMKTKYADPFADYANN